MWHIVEQVIRTRPVLAGWAVALLIGILTVVASSGYLLEPAYKQVVIEQVSNGYKISECIVQTPCSVTKVATSPLQANAIVWAYLSGKPVRPDWSEPK